MIAGGCKLRLLYPAGWLVAGRLKPIADMRKTHLIALCLAVPVILAVAFFVSMSRAPAPQPVAITEKIPLPAEPAEPAASATSPPAPVAPVPQSIRTQLRLAADPGAVIDKIRQTPGVETAEFDAKSSNLVITHPPGGPSAKALAAAAEQAGVVVRGEVMDLPLAMENPHLETCGSCGLVIYEQLQKMPGVHAVEVFVPVKNQLRLLVVPESNTASDIADFLTRSRHPATSNP